MAVKIFEKKLSNMAPMSPTEFFRYKIREKCQLVHTLIAH